MNTMSKYYAAVDKDSVVDNVVVEDEKHMKMIQEQLQMLD